MYSTIAASLYKKATVEMHHFCFFFVLLDVTIIYADLFIVEIFISLLFFFFLQMSESQQIKMIFI